MKMKFTISTSFLVVAVFGKTTQSLNTKKFPPKFMFGTATAAYQIEGGWNEDGKGENNWDHLSHSPLSPIYDHHTGDVACDSYHKYKEDVQLLKHLGVNHYRFSISWSRILPSGFDNKINPLGIQYYKNLIKELKDNGIEPLVTMHHWDTPQPLENIGGWTNEKIVDMFADYARILYENFGDDIKYWTTFNEPKQTCQQGYGSGLRAPAIKSHGIGEYLCTHNLLKAHAKAWHMYDDEYRQKQHGFVGITLDSMWMELDTDSELDKAAAERAIQFTFGWFANPIIKGDYPWQMKQFIARRSLAQGFSESRLPEFTAEEIKYIKGTIDYLGVNQYTAGLVRHVEDKNRTKISWEADQETYNYQPEHWEKTAANWLKSVPWSMRKLVNWISKTYGNIPQFITENGYADNGTTLEDDRRIHYYQETLSNLRDAMDDGANVIGYTAWSLMDNFEWYQGYKERFGLYYVDFTSPERTRTPKKSVAYIKHVFETRCIVDKKDCTEESNIDTIVKYIHKDIDNHLSR
ncbi:myrosinase 1-like [Diabrotica virgifera virgifera]|uniref:Myrosinase 1-like n=1 Tax=Diabrotica virgifera virgifera TaxID=50390 RepID=A0ABM5KQZ6_DIAVI|nr:myrosinase 1-like [Diabrotica virgifera virgifera]